MDCKTRRINAKVAPDEWIPRCESDWNDSGQGRMVMKQWILLHQGVPCTATYLTSARFIIRLAITHRVYTTTYQSLTSYVSKW